MQPLTATDIVTIWDRGRQLHSIDRALLLLAAGMPEATPQALRDLTVGQRNGRLLHLRQLTIGEDLTAIVACPQCGETLEFTVAVSLLRRQPEPTATSYTVTLGAQTFQLRLPTSTDLAALLNSSDMAQARSQLIARCVQIPGSSEQSVLESAVITKIADFMAEADPLADMRFALTCIDCGHSWSALFDIATFFWTELNTQARRLLLEVHRLASAYGWREPDILALSSLRRHTYLEMIGA